MKRILIASVNENINNIVGSAHKKYSNYFDFEFCVSTEEVIRNIDYEVPEIKVIDFTSSHINWEKILEEITADPWLHNGGIIAIAEDMAQVKMIEELKNNNILIVQTVDQFIKHFSRLLRILLQNQHFLFNRGIQDQFDGTESGSFVSKNDPLDIQVYASFLVNYLYSSNRIDEKTRYNLQTTLMELLFNALEHGNCGIAYDEKTVWLEQGKGILELIAKKNQNPEISKKQIHITYSIGQTVSAFTIRDDGAGFDWKSRINQKVGVGSHGMGIKMSENLVNGLTYNKKGNEVSFSVTNTQHEANTVPRIMSSYTAIEYKNKEVVCKQNERSNNLFFIVSGRYAVYANRKLVSVLTPNDMFIGEMSFLLNDCRSATILSVGTGQLLKIPKKDFLNLIRKNPHYAIFLSKLLAQRLYAQTQKITALYAAMKNTKEELNSNE